jgi:hypothetical protein
MGQTMNENTGFRLTRFGDWVGFNYSTTLTRLCGYTALLIAVIERARRDFLFLDDIREHMSLLQLPDDWLPDSISTAQLRRQIGQHPVREQAIIDLLEEDDD